MANKKIKNVMFIMLDTLQFNYLGCYGNDVVKTPNFDRFAENGVLFENAYSEGLPTIPVRRALLTGRYTLPYSGWKPLDLEDTSITDLLWCREVQTALIYDTPPMRLPKYGYSRGFDYVRFCNGHELDHETFNNVPLSEDFKGEDYVSPNWLKKDESGEYDDSSKSLIRETECYLRQRQNWESDSDNYVAVVANETDEWLKKNGIPTVPFSSGWTPLIPMSPGIHHRYGRKSPAPTTRITRAIPCCWRPGLKWKGC